jgi:hypothetical protein
MAELCCWCSGYEDRGWCDVSLDQTRVSTLGPCEVLLHCVKLEERGNSHINTQGQMHSATSLTADLGKKTSQD